MAKYIKDHPVAIATVVGGSVCGAVVCPFAAPLVVSAMGFGSGGIVAGSWAASFMSSYGGAVAANSVCAVLQSVGAAGLGAQGIATVSAAGAAVGGAASSVLAKVGGMVFKKRPGLGKSAAEEDQNKEGEKAAEAQNDEDGLAKPCEAGEEAAEAQKENQNDEVGLAEPGEKAQESQNDEALAKSCEAGEEAEEAQEVKQAVETQEV